MVTVKDLVTWNFSVSMFFGKSPKIKYNCGSCDCYNEDRISLTAIRLGNPYVVCAKCGEINDTKLKLD